MGSTFLKPLNDCSVAENDGDKRQYKLRDACKSSVGCSFNAVPGFVTSGYAVGSILERHVERIWSREKHGE